LSATEHETSQAGHLNFWFVSAILPPLSTLVDSTAVYTPLTGNATRTRNGSSFG